MINYNEIFNSEKNQKYYMLINTNMNLLLDPYTRTVYEEIIHLSNIHQKISVRTIIRLTRISNKTVQSCIKTLRQLNIIGNTGYVLNLDRIETIYNQLNSIVKLDDKLSYCDSLLNREEVENINEPEPIKQEEEEPIQEQPTIDITVSEPIKEQPIQEPIKEEEVMNNEEVTTTVQEQPKNIVTSKQELEKNAYMLINNDILLLLNGNELKVYIELIHLNNIQQKISMRTIMRFTRFSCSQTQHAIKTLRTIGIIGDKGYNLNLDRIEDIYTTLNNIIKLDDKIAYCDSLLNREQAINKPETIQQEEEEPIQEQSTINIETSTTQDITVQEPIKQEDMIEEKETVQEHQQEHQQEQPKNIVPTKQELEKNAYILINRMMQCESKKEWAEKQDKLLTYLAQDKTWNKDELNRITSAIIEAKTMWEQEKYNKAMCNIEAVYNR